MSNNIFPIFSTNNSIADLDKLCRNWSIKCKSKSKVNVNVNLIKI